jgi:hypothetical protein
VSGGDDRRWLISTAPSVERRVLDLALFRAWRAWLRPLTILCAAVAGAHFAHRLHHGKKEK